MIFNSASKTLISRRVDKVGAKVVSSALRCGPLLRLFSSPTTILYKPKKRVCPLEPIAERPRLRLTYQRRVQVQFVAESKYCLLRRFFSAATPPKKEKRKKEGKGKERKEKKEKGKKEEKKGKGGKKGKRSESKPKEE